MAYTYDDFVNAANAAGGLGQFGQNDLTAAQQHPEYGLSLLGLQKDYSKATNDQQRMLINEAANQLRSSYNVNADSGSGSFGAGQTAASGQAASGNGQSGFSYSPYTDPAYQAYRKEYLRNANRATGDALGQYSAATGGRASSYAVNAATQAGDYYATQLSDMVPTLYQSAFERYANERDAGASEKQNSYSNLVSMISSTGYMPTAEEMAAAGMNETMANALIQMWAASNPDAAYQQGKLSAEDYYRLTGKNPPDAGGSAQTGYTGTRDANTTAIQKALAAAGYGDNMLGESWYGITKSDGSLPGRTSSALSAALSDTNTDKQNKFFEELAKNMGTTADAVKKAYTTAGG